MYKNKVLISIAIKNRHFLFLTLLFLFWIECLWYNGRVKYQVRLITSFPCFTPFRAINLSARSVSSLALPLTIIVSRHKS